MPVGLPPFQALLDDHADDVLRFLAACVGPGEADDCFQETFIAALRAYPRLRRGSNVRSWLLTIAHRKAIDAHRARGRRPVPVADAGAGSAVADSGERDGDPAGLWHEVGALPQRQRAAVALRFVCDFSYRDIGRAIGCTEPAARRNVHEGLKRLREGRT